MKVEDEFKGRTKATRTDKWTDEIHEIDIDKGNEVELTVYDKAGTDHPLPIGMLWIRMSDIAEEMRRKKIETEFNNSGWVSADKTMEDGRPSRSEMQFNAPPGGLGPGSQGASFGGANSQGQSAQVWIDSWFSLEPVGRIQLSLSFGMFIGEVLICLTILIRLIHSEGDERTKTVRCWTQPQRGYSTTQGRCSRTLRPQVYCTAILQYHALRTLRRIAKVRSWYAMFGLQVHVSREMLSSGRHEMYQQVECRE